MNNTELYNISTNIRKNIINAVADAKSGHPGGSLSIADILTVLYFDKMNIDPQNSKKEDRDRFVLSKGHAAPALYSALAERGYFDKVELNTLRKYGHMLQGHPDMKSTPGVDMSTGSLGQGLSVANGMAIAGKIDKKDYIVYVILGDGEIQEGQIWEAVMTSAHYKLNNVVAFIDHNGLQIDGSNEEVMNVNSISDKFAAFGWNVLKADGHNMDELKISIDKAKEESKRPSVIICSTVKGKGVSFMENNVGWHGAAPNEEQREIAIKDLEGGVR